MCSLCNLRASLAQMVNESNRVLEEKRLTFLFFSSLETMHYIVHIYIQFSAREMVLDNVLQSRTFNFNKKTNNRPTPYKKILLLQLLRALMH